MASHLYHTEYNVKKSTAQVHKNINISVVFSSIKKIVFGFTCVNAYMSNKLTGFFKCLPTVMTNVLESSPINVLIVS